MWQTPSLPPSYVIPRSVHSLTFPISDCDKLSQGGGILVEGDEHLDQEHTVEVDCVWILQPMPHLYFSVRLIQFSVFHQDGRCCFYKDILSSWLVNVTYYIGKNKIA